MTKLLEKAFAEASKLPPEDQDVVASLVLEELASEQRWTKLFTESQDKLALLASEAAAEFRAGKTKSIDDDLSDH